VTVPPEREADPPHLNFAPLQNALDALARSAARYDSLFVATGEGDGTGYVGAAAAGLNAQLLMSERRLTNPEGLPNRSWYRHLIYAPGFYTGYAVKTLPGIREAIEQRNWQLAESEVARAAAALRDETALIGMAADLLERPVR
jgi:N-acetylated-alpha-linked acidic dipeptidase